MAKIKLFGTDNIERDTEKQVVVMSGPLGEVYTQALNIVFAKKQPEPVLASGDITPDEGEVTEEATEEVDKVESVLSLESVLTQLSTVSAALKESGNNAVFASATTQQPTSSSVVATTVNLALTPGVRQEVLNRLTAATGDVTLVVDMPPNTKLSDVPANVRIAVEASCNLMGAGVCWGLEELLERIAIKDSSK